MPGFEDIRASIMADMAVSNLDTTPGGFVDTVTRAVASEIAKCYFVQGGYTSVIFPDATSGPYIDAWANTVGLERKPGTKATGTVDFVGNNGATIAAGTLLQTDDSLIFVTDAAGTIADGAATVAVTAQAVGADYNVGENAIKRLVNTGAVTVLGSSVMVGGTDEESDEALLQRFNAHRQRPQTSGNAYQYEAWALEVVGIGRAKVIPVWDGGGTVKVLVLDSEMQPATEAQVQAVAENIAEQRPVGVEVTVEAAEALSIAVAASGVTVTPETSLPAVQAAFASLAADYLASIAFIADEVAYNRFIFLLLSIPGVLDFSELTINAGVQNIPLAQSQVATLGEVVVS